MVGARAAAKKRRLIEISLRADLIDEAERLGVDLSEACEHGLRQELSKAWLEENKEALEDWNRYIRENGLPLARYRLF